MLKGKNYSLKDVTGKRKKSDFYETPYSMTESILDELDIHLKSTILEPSSGNGAITKILNKRGYSNITSGDISTGQDFLYFDYNKNFD